MEYPSLQHGGRVPQATTAALSSAFSCSANREAADRRLLTSSAGITKIQHGYDGLYFYNVYLLLELLFVKFGYLSVSCLSHADITYAVDSICIS